MKSWLMSVLNVMVTASAVAVMLLMLPPIGIEARYTREVETGRNGTDGDGERWPIRMTLSCVSFVCNTPSPNFDVTDEQLNTAWRLPPRSRLSPMMRQIGRCKLAAESLRKNGVFGFDDRKCYCVEAWWSVFVFGIALVAMLFYTVQFILPTKGNPADQLFELRSARCFAAWWTMLWYLAMLIYTMRKFHAGVYFTVYGDMYPQAYYNVEPINWFIVFILSVFCCLIEGIKFLIFASAVRKAKTQCGGRIEAGTGRQPPPPSYETIRFGYPQKMLAMNEK